MHFSSGPTDPTVTKLDFDKESISPSKFNTTVDEIRERMAWNKTREAQVNTVL